MTRGRYVGITLFLLLVAMGVAILAASSALGPLMYRPLEAFGETSRKTAFWMSAFLMILWIVTLPLWTWATWHRFRVLARPVWPVLIPGGLSLAAILTGLAAGLLLGADPGPFDPDPGVPVSEAFASVETIMREIPDSWMQRYWLGLALDLVGSMLLIAACAAIALCVGALARPQDRASDRSDHNRPSDKSA